MATDRRVDPLVLLRGLHGAQVRLLVEADREDVGDAHPPGVGHQFRVRRVADVEVRVAVDHAASSSFGKSGGIRSTVCPPPREPNAEISRDSSRSAARSRSDERGM